MKFNKKGSAVFQLFIIMLSLFAFSFIVSDKAIVTAAIDSESTACCEKLNSGVSCQNALATECKSGTNPATNFPFKAAPTLCESTSYCQTGTCYNSVDGICMPNIPKVTCEANNYNTWDSRSMNQVPQCQLGCCIIADQAAFVTLTRCKSLSQSSGASNNFRTDITDEDSCIATANSQDKGACVFERDFQRICDFTTRVECGATSKIQATGGNLTISDEKTFYEGYLCSAEVLATTCAKQTSTECYQGNVYWVDSCGNRENVLSDENVDAGKDTISHYSGKVKAPDISYDGNCNYLDGKRCAAKGGIFSSNQQHECKSTDCKADLNMDGIANDVVKNGESWCILPGTKSLNRKLNNVFDLEGFHGNGDDRPGSRFFRQVCMDGEVVTEPCSDFRNEICIEGKIKTADITTDIGRDFMTAACRVNRWQDCTQQVWEDDCTNTAKRDCIWKDSVVGLALIGIDEETGKVLDDGTDRTMNGANKVCVPSSPPGLNFWEDGSIEETCALGNAKCEKTFERNFGGGEHLDIESIIDGGNAFVGGDEPVYGDKNCGDDDWFTDANEICVSLGDCGGFVSYSGVYSDDGYRAISMDWNEDNEEWDSEVIDLGIKAGSVFPVVLLIAGFTGKAVVGYDSGNEYEVIDINLIKKNDGTLYTYNEQNNNWNYELNEKTVLVTGRLAYSFDDWVNEYKTELILKEEVERDADAGAVVAGYTDENSDSQTNNNNNYLYQDPLLSLLLFPNAALANSILSSAPPSFNYNNHIYTATSSNTFKRDDGLVFERDGDGWKWSGTTSKDIKVTIDTEGSMDEYNQFIAGANKITGEWEVFEKSNDNSEPKNIEDSSNIDGFKCVKEGGSRYRIFYTDNTPTEVVDCGDNFICKKRGYKKIECFNPDTEQSTKVGDETKCTTEKIAACEEDDKKCDKETGKCKDKFDIEGIISALALAGTAATASYFVGTFVGNFFGGDDSESAAWGSAFGAAAATTTFLTSEAIGMNLKGWGGAIGLGVGVAIFLMSYADTTMESYEFQCLPWQPEISKDNNCQLCQEDDLPCSEYTCRSLGLNCELVNKGSKDELCVNINPNDVNPPVILPNKGLITKNYEYTPIKTLPSEAGFRIQKVGGGDIEPFEQIQFGITIQDDGTDKSEPAQCKIDFEHKDNFDDMIAYMGGSNLYKYNHTERFALPSVIDMTNASMQLENGNDMTFYIRCRDKNGNENEADFEVKLRIKDSPDTTAPQIISTTVQNGGCINAETSSLEVIFYTNEVANCRWSQLDQDYESMSIENQMSCTYRSNKNQLFPCTTELKGVVKAGTNFYIRCEDDAANDGLDLINNKMSESLKFSLHGSTGLIMKNMQPNGSEVIYGAVNPMPVELYVETAMGCSNGLSVCQYSVNGGEFIEFFDTYNEDGIHTQRLYLEGNKNRKTHEYTIKCTDDGGNQVVANGAFELEIDEDTPIVARVYEEAGMLKLVTVRDSECSYSFQSCNFELEEGTVMPYANSTVHVAEWNSDKTFYIKCQDEFKNAESGCSIIVRPTKDFL